MFNKNGDSALMVASRKGHGEVERLLLAYAKKANKKVAYRNDAERFMEELLLAFAEKSKKSEL